MQGNYFKWPDSHGHWRSPHVPEHQQTGLSLFAEHSLEEHQKYQREHAIIPIVVQTPQQKAQYLKYEEGGHEMFLCLHFYSQRFRKFEEKNLSVRNLGPQSSDENVSYDWDSPCRGRKKKALEYRIHCDPIFVCWLQYLRHLCVPCFSVSWREQRYDRLLIRTVKHEAILCIVYQRKGLPH